MPVRNRLTVLFIERPTAWLMWPPASSWLSPARAMPLVDRTPPQGNPFLLLLGWAILPTGAGEGQAGEGDDGIP
jgi:hypothetical protein